MFLRGLALIYIAAFTSMAGQIEGLIGSEGILPVKALLAAVTEYLPENRYLTFPTVFWFDASDSMLISVCYLGIAAAFLLLFNILPSLSISVCYLLYLSITVVGQDFTAFQWDAFLLEAGFLALFLPWRSIVVVYLYRWLIARFMFMGGVVKLSSGDVHWADFSALDFHYLTQPLPSPLAYYAYYLPHGLHRFGVAGVFFIELLLPFFVFLPRRFRRFAAGGFVTLQVAIMLTGNYGFFNLLAVLLCLFLVDDNDLRKIVPKHLCSNFQLPVIKTGWLASGLAVSWFAVVILVCGTYVWLQNLREPIPQSLKTLLEVTSAFSAVNNYGPFAVMTTERPEIIIQGSNDGFRWQTYKFNYKPVDLDQPLQWNIPHQPRLDWQMWFAALQEPEKGRWFDSFMRKIQAGSPQVLGLLAYNPFQGKPPRYLRASLYRYFYAGLKQRAETGQIWQREYIGEYWQQKRELIRLIR